MKFPKFMALLIAGLMVSACSESDPVPQRDVNAVRMTSKIRGYIVPDGIVMAKSFRRAWVQEIATGYSRRKSIKIPAKVDFLKSDGRCEFTEPSDKEFVGHVFFSSGQKYTSIFNIHNSELRKKAKTFVSIYKSSGADVAKARITKSRSMKLIDVFVTEKSKPVYLVLTTHSNIIWNINKAKGVKISRIVLIGQRNVGVVNADPEVPVEVLHGGGLQRCKVIPIREPHKHWALVRNAKLSSGSREALEKSERLAGHFSKWLFNMFGVRAVEDIVQANRASHAIIGEVPALDQRMAYQTIEGKIVRITPADKIIAISKTSFVQQYKAMVISIATKMAGGDLTILKPGG